MESNQSDKNINVFNPTRPSDFFEHYFPFYEQIHNADVKLSKRIYDTTNHYKPIFLVSKVIEWFSDTLALPIFLFVYGFLREPSPIAFAVYAIAFALIGEFGIKMIFRRNRPSWSTKQGFAFPSSHATVSGICIAVATIMPLPIFAVVFLFGILIPLSRITRGYHYSFDVFCGLVYGLLAGLVWQFISVGLLLP